MSTDDARRFVPVGIAVLTVSDSRGLAEDTSGRVLIERVAASGHRLAGRAIVPDDPHRIRAQVAAWVVDPTVQAVITTGGTGITGRDGTPEAVAPLLDKCIDGFGEVFRAVSFGEIGASTIQSRAIAGVANGTFVFCLPGSSGACRTGWEHLIGPQLDYRTRPCNLVELMPRLLER